MDQRFKELLWNDFLECIEKDWPSKYENYGTLNSINQQSNLSRAISLDMEKHFKKLSGNYKAPAWNSINNYLNAASFPTNVKKGTLDSFSAYLNYKDFKDFRESNHRRLAINRKEPELPRNINKKPFILLTLIAGIIMIFLFLQRDKRQKKIQISHEDKAEIRALIDRANNCEFNLYAKVPNLRDTVELDEYFTQKGQARKNIIDVLKRTNKKNHRLDTENSFRQLNYYDIRFLEPIKDTVVVETIEHWKLLWQNELRNKIVASYDAINLQNYFLVKGDREWLIVKNTYVGKAERYSKEKSIKE